MCTSNASTMLEEVRRAGQTILGGGTILYPTDTIWGIGCDATNPEAVGKIYRIKRRSDHKRMLVLMSGMPMLSKYLLTIPDQARQIIGSAERPTTIIYPGGRNLAPNLLSEEGSIGIRITADPFCLQLIEWTGRPIVSTSANLSGKPSPALFSEIDEAVIKRMDYVVDWRREETDPAAPSVIIELDSAGTARTIRP